MTGVAGLANAIANQTTRAADARWFVVGLVNAYSGGRITATIDGTTVTGIRALASWVPAAGEVALFGVVRGGASVQYVGVGALEPTTAGGGSALDVKAFGAVGDDVADDTAALQAALTSAATYGSTVYIPAGTYRISDTLHFTDNVSIEGDGTIHQVNSAKNGLQYTASGILRYNGRIKGIKLEGPGQGVGTGVALKIGSDTANATLYVHLSDVQANGWGSHGFHLRGLIVSQLDNCLAQNVGGTGFWIDGTDSWSTSIALNACYANHCTASGYKVNKATYLSFNGCAADSNDICYNLDNVSTTALTGCGAESAPGLPSRIGYQVDGDVTFGSFGVTMTSCYATELTEKHFNWIGYSAGTMTGCRAWSVTPGVNTLNVTSPAGVAGMANTLPAPHTVTGAYMSMDPLDPTWSPSGLSASASAPTLLPWSDSIQVINRGSTSNVPLIVRAMTSQAAALLKFQTSAYANILSIDPTGGLVFGSDEATWINRPSTGLIATNGVFRTGTATSAAMPSASTMGAGAQVYVTTTGKPAWSDGTAWRYADGTAV